MYDQNFRQQAAEVGSTEWARVDPSIYTQCFTGMALSAEECEINMKECEINMKIMEQMCKDTGTPVEEDKCEGPTTTIRFLGIELDTVAMEMRLPEDKLQQVHDWRGKKAVSKRELLSLIGSLQHACKAVRPGRSFMRWLIDLSKQATRLDHHLRLNSSARSDTEWWHRFTAEWNGTSMFMQVKRDVPDVVVTSDASGSWGCGAFSGSQW